MTDDLRSRATARVDRELVAVAAVVVAGATVTTLDTTVVNVALNVLARDLDAPLATIQWVATGYLLALAAAIPLTGWAADRFGARRLFAASVALFSAASALCGAAWSAESLIAARVVQGIGGGLILPAGITLVGQTAGPQRMGRVMGAIGVPMLLGPVAGPIVGGWLVDAVSWRAIFLVNVPVGAAVVALALRLLPADRPTGAARLDSIGLALLSPGLAALVYGLAQAASAGGSLAVGTLAPIAGGVLLLTAFAVHALRVAEPLLDLRLLRTGPVAASAATLALLGAAFMGALVLLPLFFQIVRGESTLRTGLLLIPQGAGAAVAMGLCGRLADAVGAGRVVLAGLVPFAAGLAALTRVGPDTSPLALAAVLLAFGVGMGATMMPAMTAAYQTLSHAQVARATTVLTIVQRVGSSAGAALVAVVLAGALAARLPGTTDAVALAAAQRVDPRDGARLAALAEAFGDAFRWPLACALAAAVPAAFLPRRVPRPDDGGR